MKITASEIQVSGQLHGDRAPAPCEFSLLPNPIDPREKSLLYRRNLILSRMAKTGHISDEAYVEAVKAPLFHRRDEVSDVSY